MPVVIRVRFSNESTPIKRHGTPTAGALWQPTPFDPDRRGATVCSGLHGWFARMSRSRVTIMKEYCQVVANSLVGRHGRFEQSFLNGAVRVAPGRESRLAP